MQATETPSPFFARLIPAVRRSVLEPLWGRWSRSGATLLDEWRALEQSQHLPEKTLRERQGHQLKSLLEFVHENNGFYRQRLDEAAVAPSTLRSLEDFRRVPILTKAEVRSHATEMLSRGFDPTQLIRAKTGGSTGKPMEVLFTEEVSQLRNASGRRSKRWSGWEPGEPMGAAWGNPAYQTTLRGRVREWVLSPVIYLDTMSMTPDAVRQFAREWARTLPTLLFGHAHSIFVLASMVAEMDVSEIRPHAIITSSMMLLPHERVVIERVFSVKVTDLYGCEEVGLIASECERHEGLHLNIDHLIVEVLRDDGTPVAPGESGLVVVTDLLNRAMPFIRYRMEDMAELSDVSCSCGRGLPLLRRVMGRTADFLRRHDGSRVAGISLIENTLTRIPGLEQMQIVQEALLRIVLRIVPGVDFSDTNRRELVGYFEATFPGARIEVEEVTSIPQEPNGKYRFAICRMD